MPSPVKMKLVKLIQDFSEKEKRVKWVDPENMHVTIKFFGDIEEDVLNSQIIPVIEKVVNEFGNIKLASEGMGVFPNWKYARVLWAGFTGDVERILVLHDRIEASLAHLDLHKDKRQFRLHLTLGRSTKELKNTPIVNLIEKLGTLRFGVVNVEKLILYKSVLTKNGPVYTELKSFTL